MRAVPLYVALCAAAIMAAARCDDGSPTGYFGRRLEPIDLTADQETLGYLLPRLGAKYRPDGRWEGAVADPRFYLLTEMERGNNGNIGNNNRIFGDDNENGNAAENQEPADRKLKRGLSVSHFLDTLRGLLENSRYEHQKKINKNHLLEAGKK